jgi:hypothetical protein
MNRSRQSELFRTLVAHRIAGFPYVRCECGHRYYREPTQVQILEHMADAVLERYDLVPRTIDSGQPLDALRESCAEMG